MVSHVSSSYEIINGMRQASIGTSSTAENPKDPPGEAPAKSFGCLKPLVLYIVFLTFIYLRHISPEWKQATVLRELKQIERGRQVKLNIDSKDTLYC